MTTRSVHRYVTETLKKLNLDESSVTKIQTGGPDGDLGSNEILISKDSTLAIVDGSGVLYDPERHQPRRADAPRQGAQDGRPL
jgi:glutamate dehydrogenase